MTIDEKWLIEGESIPVDDNTFDYVFYFASFHHVQNPQRAVGEACRALKKGGIFYLLLEPACPKIFSSLYDWWVKREIREKYFTKKQYLSMLKKFFPSVKLYNFTGYYNRESKGALLYYLVLSIMPQWLCGLFPCSQVVIARKK